jgi:Family of unknown function (DUF5670)
MLWTIFVVLLILWLLGFQFAYRRRSDPLAACCRVSGSGHTFQTHFFNTHAYY